MGASLSLLVARDENYLVWVIERKDGRSWG